MANNGIAQAQGAQMTTTEASGHSGTTGMREGEAEVHTVAEAMGVEWGKTLTVV